MTKKEFDQKILYLKSLGIDTDLLTAEEFALYFNAANQRDIKTIEDMIDEKDRNAISWME